MSFLLHPRLAAGTFPLGRRDGCQVLLKNNSLFPWILIVPEVSTDIEDLHQLPEDQFQRVSQLIRDVSLFASSHFQPDKLNVGCIGNMVRQMHIHIVARNESDPAWPGTVWACSEKATYMSAAVDAIRSSALAALSLEELSSD